MLPLPRGVRPQVGLFVLGFSFTAPKIRHDLVEQQRVNLLTFNNPNLMPRCERCGVPYCCDDHLRSHVSKTREDYCLPFRIRHRAEVSRLEIFLSCILISLVSKVF